MVKGLKNAYLMHFSSLHSWFRCHVCFTICNAHLHSAKGSKKGQKTFFFAKICFISCIIINRSHMYPSEKNTNQLTVRGGGSTLTVSLTVKYPFFFFDGFPNQDRTTSHINVYIMYKIETSSRDIGMPHNLWNY